MTESDAMYVGVDGCKGGWFSVGLDDNDAYTFNVHSEFRDVLNSYPEAHLILVDIPVGLPCPGPDPRDCDTEARKNLGSPRRSSVFRVPIREAAYMVTKGASRKETDKLSRSRNSKGIGAQAFNIMKKIAEVDMVLGAQDQNVPSKIREVHPEVCFWGLNGKSAMLNKKKAREGIEERIGVLQSLEPRAKAIYECALSTYMRKVVARDDILDALVAAITAKLGWPNNLKTLPECPPTDCKDLPMEMVYVEAAHSRP